MAYARVRQMIQPKPAAPASCMQYMSAGVETRRAEDDRVINYTLNSAGGLDVQRDEFTLLLIMVRPGYLNKLQRSKFPCAAAGTIIIKFIELLIQFFVDLPVADSSRDFSQPVLQIALSPATFSWGSLALGLGLGPGTTPAYGKSYVLG